MLPLPKKTAVGFAITGEMWLEARRTVASFVNRRLSKGGSTYPRDPQQGLAATRTREPHLHGFVAPTSGAAWRWSQWEQSHESGPVEQASAGAGACKAGIGGVAPASGRHELVNFAPFV